MQIAVSSTNAEQEQSETQLAAIRELMAKAAIRREWMTLSEIAGLTEFGEASISAQLRHLRKPRFGRHRVEKRLRRQTRADGECRSANSHGSVWEYRVLPKE